MFKKVFCLTFAVCFLFAVSAVAADLKIGVFNSQSIAMQSDAAKASQQRLQSQYGKERSQIEKEAKDLQAKGQNLQKMLESMDAKTRETKQMEYIKQRRAFEEKSRAFARKLEGSENTIRQGMAQFIFQASAAVAKEKDLDLIIDAAMGSVMFAKPELDLTKPVLAEVNRLWKQNGNKFPTAPKK